MHGASEHADAPTINTLVRQRWARLCANKAYAPTRNTPTMDTLVRQQGLVCIDNGCACAPTRDTGTLFFPAVSQAQHRQKRLSGETSSWPRAAQGGGPKGKLRPPAPLPTLKRRPARSSPAKQAPRPHHSDARQSPSRGPL